MKIGLDVQSTLGQKTGIGSYTAQLLAALRSIAPEHTYSELSMGRDVVMRIDRRLQWQQCEVTRQARRNGIDLLHVPGFDAPARHPCPVILTVHDLIGMLFPRNLPPAARFYWSRWLPFSVRFADRIIADSEHTRRDIVRLLGVSAVRITVVPLAAGRQYRVLAPDDNALAVVRAKYGLEEPFILFVSTIEPRKGLDTLIDAFVRLGPANERCRLVITGKRGWYTEELLPRVERLGLSPKVLFTGYVSDEELPALYNAASVLAFPSRYEGFGMTVLEAMACGTPVISSNSSSLPEVAGEAGLLVSPDRPEELAQALLRVLESTVLQQEMRERGLVQAARFSWERTAQQTLAVYEDAIAREARR